ncbi:MAG: hypothetical protein SFV54_20845 [Bryobacteraceae bacterium]|nr:hypothetical protein [Bryobacteraceae bacterium]
MMGRVVVPGRVFVAAGTQLPRGMTIDTDRYCQGWLVLTGPNRGMLQEKLEKAGWTFFYLAGVLKSNAWGLNQERGAARALRRLLSGVAAARFNCMVVDSITTRRFSAWSGITVCAHARHIQEAGQLMRERAVPKPYRLYIS